MLTAALVDQILAAAPRLTVGLLGDLFLDRYLDIDPARDEPSVETGLTAYQVVGVRSYPGALGTVLNNLSALGVGRILPVAVIGDDGEGYELQQALDRTPGVDAAGVFAHPGRRTPTYTKPMYGKEELNRLDIKNRTATPPDAEDRLIAAVESLWPTLDALLVLDQVSEDDCGVVTTRVRDRLSELAAGDPAKFVLADSRERVRLFRRVCVKPNLAELLKATDGDAAGHTDGRVRMAWLANETGGPVVLTRGADPAYFFRPGMEGGDMPAIPAFPVSGPTDTCGAGDSCSAGLATAVAAGATLEQAAAFGNLVASVTVQQIGTTGTATPEQVRRRWAEVHPA